MTQDLPHKIPWIDYWGDVQYRDSSNIHKLICSNRKEQLVYIEFHAENSLRELDLSAVLDNEFLEKLKVSGSDHLLILHNIYEGFDDLHPVIYERLIGQENIDPRNILLVTANHHYGNFLRDYCEKNSAPLIRCEHFDVCEFQSQNTLKRDLFEDDNGPLLFTKETTTLNINQITQRYLNLNRRWRPHRPVFVGLLKSKGLLNKGLVSLGPSDCNKDNWNNFDTYLSWLEDTELHKDFIEHKEDIINMPPLYVDTDDLVTNRASHSKGDHGLYESTLISVVSETKFFNITSPVYHSERGVFLTEKIMKAIMHKHPFIVISNHNFLNVLHGKGYDSFPEFIDETYDAVEDDVTRMKLILREVEKICQWDDQKVNEFCEYAKPIVEHNFEVLLNAETSTLKVFS